MSLEQLLRCEPSYVCVGAYDRGRAALAGISRTGAGLVLMDIRMPGMSGIECTLRLTNELSDLTVVMVTAASSQQAIRDSIQAGCRGYLVKPFSSGQFWSVLACALGHTVMKPQLMRPEFCCRKLTGLEHCPRLSPRQHAVLQHVATGLNQKEVAEALKCSRDSVEQALKRAYMKFGVKNCAGVLPLMANCQACRLRSGNAEVGV